MTVDLDALKKLWRAAGTFPWATQMRCAGTSVGRASFVSEVFTGVYSIPCGVVDVCYAEEFHEDNLGNGYVRKWYTPKTPKPEPEPCNRALLIVAMQNAVPALIDELREARALLLGWEQVGWGGPPRAEHGDKCLCMRCLTARYFERTAPPAAQEDK